MNRSLMRRQARRTERNLRTAEGEIQDLIAELKEARERDDAVFCWPDWMQALQYVRGHLMVAFDLAKNAAVECGLADDTLQDAAEPFNSKGGD